jgi:hypothetical protein
MRFANTGFGLSVIFLLGGTLALALFAQNQKKDEEPSDDSFVDEALLVSKLGNAASVSQYSLQEFVCQEQLKVVETGKSLSKPVIRELSSKYEVRREKAKQTSLQRRLIESRTSANSAGQESESSSLNFPTMEKPFTGFLGQMFTSENRLNLDFRTLKKEVKNGHNCVLLDFQPMEHLDPLKIELMGQWISLIQHGQVWVDTSTNHPVSVIAEQQKLPKEWRVYKYEADFASTPALGPRVVLPIHIQLQVETKERRYQVEQTYSNFQLLSR